MSTPALHPEILALADTMPPRPHSRAHSLGKLRTIRNAAYTEMLLQLSDTVERADHVVHDDRRVDLTVIAGAPHGAQLFFGSVPERRWARAVKEWLQPRLMNTVPAS